MMLLPSGDVASDGHPCEAALEFRRAAFRAGVAEDVPSDALDLAIAIAWIGKAVSRTAEADVWLKGGVDPNTWQMVRACAADPEALRRALKTAREGLDPRSAGARPADGRFDPFEPIDAPAGGAPDGDGQDGGVLHGFWDEIVPLRNSAAFGNACLQVERALDGRNHPRDAARYAALKGIARRVPGPVAREMRGGPGNVVAVDFRGRRRR